MRHEVEQNSPEWLKLRLGIPTASNFHKILTKKTRKLSAQADGYACEKIAEWLLGQPLDSASSGFMERGSEMQAEAEAWYSARYDVDLLPGAFYTLDDGSAGCSPDFIVGDDGGGEIKCPGAARHVENLLLDSADDYFLQCQGCLWITGRKWWDIISYHPTIPPRVLRVERDEEWIADIAAAVAQFNERVAELKLLATERGAKPIEPGQYCRFKTENGNWCFGRNGLTQVGGEWRCERHAGGQDAPGGEPRASRRVGYTDEELEVAAQFGGFT